MANKVHKNSITVNFNDPAVPLLNGVSVLVVEDADDVREMLALMLTRYGARVKTAMDGMEAVAKVQTDNFDCILMDIRMPGLDGNETAQKIQENLSSAHRKTSFIAVSGEMNKETLTSKPFPFSDWVSKPVQPRMLSQLIYNCLHPQTK
jgi:CheY-like chemotaxis protein